MSLLGNLLSDLQRPLQGEFPTRNYYSCARKASTVSFVATGNKLDCAPPKIRLFLPRNRWGFARGVMGGRGGVGLSLLFTK